jgi:hypothetical protein
MGFTSRRLAWAVEERDHKLIWYRRVAGESYGELARRFAITRQRVGAILKAKAPELMGKSRPR